MASVNTYTLSDELCVEDFVLIAVHSSLEDHALVYALNSHLKLKLRRSNFDLEMTELGNFPVFEWKDNINDRLWTLIINNNVKEEQLNRPDLFQNEISHTVSHLIPEHREVDYFLKVEQGDECLEFDITKTLLTIPNIVTAYIVNTEQLKSKQNLIF